jgi:transcriptional regulator with XRE-family HTH domain
MDRIFNNTIDRLKYFIEYKGISIRKFSELTGISHSLINKINSIGSDKLENILSSFPELNAEWLLTGNGEMIKTASGSDLNTKVDVLQLLKEKDETIIHLAQENGALKNQLEELKNGQ